MTMEDRGLTIIGAALAVFILVAFCSRPRPDSAVREHLERADSLVVTQPVLDSQLARSARARADSQAVARRLEAQERARRRSADSARRVADSLRAAVDSARTLRDSFTVLQAAYERRTAEADTLRAELAAKERRLALLVVDTTRLRADLDSARRRLAVVETLNRDLARDLRNAGCTWGLGWRCPSRKEVAATMLVLEGGLRLAEAIGRR